MIEVFRTNVRRKAHARMLLASIHRNYRAYTAKFDLQDRDNILRVKSATSEISVSCLIELLENFGFHAELLPDSIAPIVFLPAKASTKLIHVNR